MLPFLGAIGTVELYSGWLLYQGWLNEVKRDAGDFFVGTWADEKGNEAMRCRKDTFK